MVIFYKLFLLTFFICFKNIYNQVLKHFYDRCFKILISSFQHLIQLITSTGSLSFLMKVAVSLVLSMMSGFTCVLDILSMRWQETESHLHLSRQQAEERPGGPEPLQCHFGLCGPPGAGASPGRADRCLSLGKGNQG